MADKVQRVGISKKTEDQSKKPASMAGSRPKRARRAKASYREDSGSEWEADWEDDVPAAVSHPGNTQPLQY